MRTNGGYNGVYNRPYTIVEHASDHSRGMAPVLEYNRRAMKSIAALLICALTLNVVSCRPASSAAADDKSKVHVGIVFDIGGKDDRSFNAAAWQGVNRAERWENLWPPD